MFDRDTIKLLRFPFSAFLMPIYWLALSIADYVSAWKAGLIFLILHGLVYPASNGYNSYVDKDDGSIGLLKNPPKPTEKLFYISLFMDLAALLLSLLLSLRFFAIVLIYVLISRAYSSSKIRIKKYPYLSFLMVFFFQGAFIFAAVFMEVSGNMLSEIFYLCRIYGAIAASLLIGSAYPLTQIYQHREDLERGDRTLSSVLGYAGTFLFSGILFISANLALYQLFRCSEHKHSFLLTQVFLFPSALYFVYWMIRVVRNHAFADYRHAMYMNILGSLCLNACFITLFIINRTL